MAAVGRSTKIDRLKTHGEVTITSTEPNQCVQVTLERIELEEMYCEFYSRMATGSIVAAKARLRLHLTPHLRAGHAATDIPTG